MKRKLIFQILSATLSGGWFIYYFVSALSNSYNKKVLFISLGVVVVIILVMIAVNDILQKKENKQEEKERSINDKKE